MHQHPKNKTRRLVLFAALLAATTFLPGCKSQLGYFEVEPSTKPPKAKFDRTLHVYLGDLRDTVIVKGETYKHLVVTDFHRTVKYAMNKALELTFDKVVYTDRPDSSVLMLHVYRMEPYWKTLRSRIIEFDQPRWNLEINYGAGAFQLHVNLYDQGKPIVNASGESLGSISTHSRRKKKLAEAFSDGLRVAVEELHYTTFVKSDIIKNGL